MITAEEARKTTNSNVQREEQAQEEQAAQRRQHTIQECQEMLPGWIQEAEKQIERSKERNCTLSPMIRAGIHFRF